MPGAARSKLGSLSRLLGLLTALLAPLLPTVAPADPPADSDEVGPADPFAAPRSDMVATLRRYSTLGGIRLGEGVLDAMARVPRHEFIPESQRAFAYDDRPLPIGHGQTISQPYIVALMTELAALSPGDRVLEVGTGSGYQAAVLSPLVARVYTIEIVEPLGREAAEALRRAGCSNVETRIGDGYAGWPEAAPFDAILVTAAPEAVPEPLIQQLAPGGRLVVPVGNQRGNQQLTVLEKGEDGTVKKREVAPVRFVPLTRQD